MDGNNQRPRGDFNMQSDAPKNKSSSTPLRAAVARPENQEFNVAGQDFGGLPLGKQHTCRLAPCVSPHFRVAYISWWLVHFILPLSNATSASYFFLIRYALFIDITDKAVKDAIKSGKKAPESINEALENLEHHVDVPLKKPTQTVFSSMGGGRNASSTEIGSRGRQAQKRHPKELCLP